MWLMWLNLLPASSEDQRLLNVHNVLLAWGECRVSSAYASGCKLLHNELLVLVVELNYGV